MKKASGRNTFKMLFLFGPASARSYKIGAVGNIWLVGNAVFSNGSKDFFDFLLEVRDYKGRKVTEPDF